MPEPIDVDQIVYFNALHRMRASLSPEEGTGERALADEIQASLSQAHDSETLYEAISEAMGTLEQADQGVDLLAGLDEYLENCRTMAYQGTPGAGFPIDSGALQIVVCPEQGCGYEQLLMSAGEEYYCIRHPERRLLPAPRLWR